MMKLQDFADGYKTVRRTSERICSPLEKEDYVVQPCAEVSPPKWHLAHTSWFFEEMILKRFVEGYRPFSDRYGLLFNSYYKAAGKHWLQSERGTLSRPTVDEVLAYRHHVDQHMQAFMDRAAPDHEALSLVELGLHHEQQHQELLYMDIKYILGANPDMPSYERLRLPAAAQPSGLWQDFAESIYDIGAAKEAFSFDNERPRHRTYAQAFRISKSLVTNAAYKEFIEDRGYKEPKLWLSAGWDLVGAGILGKPLYWFERDGHWFEYTLHGPIQLDPNAPVTHISYYEADAFAAWAGARLPTEVEAELLLVNGEQQCHEPPAGVFHPVDANAPSGQAWFWTRSHYSPYPGFQPFSGTIAEYNGKFMCNQFVLRGGCFATPRGHLRPTYRNFYLPQQRWMFSGIRLAKDL